VIDPEKLLIILISAIVGVAIKTLTDKAVFDKLMAKMDLIVAAITGLDKSMALRENEIEHLTEELKRNEREHDELYKRLNRLEQK